MTPQNLADLHAAAFTQDRPWSAEEFAALLDSPHCHLTDAAHGFALWRAVAGEAELLTIATHPDHRRQGVAKALMQRWMGDAQTRAGTAFLEVAADNTAAIRLYARFGFDEVARRTGYYKRAGQAVDALILRVDLPVSSFQKPIDSRSR
ncbi:GNAT family N-acetyltransferase [uncultured Tateyamaria sp.]|uniref:GNAT family N-acetyltransferase n=1 Tax=uncultured Tateyamaria sp. TaxID=455651 RepID=UPI0026021A2C|nr:GNAT family N-acetyltransferase [uncultured Tateyamaria sp.]